MSHDHQPSHLLHLGTIGIGLMFTRQEALAEPARLYACVLTCA
jgi:hypothetical protein